jgi:hypothetical protein
LDTGAALGYRRCDTGNTQGIHFLVQWIAVRDHLFPPSLGVGKMPVGDRRGRGGAEGLDGETTWFATIVGARSRLTMLVQESGEHSSSSHEPHTCDGFATAI